MTNYIKNLRIVYFITLISPLVLIGIFSLAIDKGTVMMNDSIDEIFKYLIPIFGMLFIPIGFILFKKRLKSVVENDDISSKLQLYRGIVVLRIALIEGVAILSAIAFLITLNNLYTAYTLISLAFYLPIYPTIDKIKADLNIEQDSIDLPTTEQRNKNFFGKNPWVIIPFIVIIIFLNFDAIKDLTSNNVKLPNIKIDNGTIVDSTYYNEFLGWTLTFPADYNKISLSEIEASEQRGKEMLNRQKNEKQDLIRLLNISNDFINLKSNLIYRAYYPDIKNSNGYLNLVDSELLSTNFDSITIEKTESGDFYISESEFKFNAYLLKGERNVGMIFFNKFLDDFIFEISITYTDSEELEKILIRIRDSDLALK